MREEVGWMKSDRLDKITDKRVTSFINQVKKKFSAKVILFGSRARGDALEESDYDFCVISEKFEGLDLHKRLQSIYSMLLINPFNAEVLAVTPKEYERLSGMLTIYSEVRKYGVLV